MALAAQAGRARASRVCLDCRALLLADEGCECGGEVVAPASPAGALRLEEIAWRGETPPRPPPVVRRPTFLARVGSLLGFGARASAPPVVPLVAASVAPTLAPFGIRWPRLRDDDSATFHGVLDGKPSLLAPLSGEACLAWALWIVGTRGLLLRDARCGRAIVHGDDGDEIELDPGRIELCGEPKVARPFSMAVADAFLVEHRLHPPPALVQDSSNPTHPFHGERSFELVLAAGDRVALSGSMVTEVEPISASTYRSRIALRRAPIGVPRVMPLAGLRL
jgi:hypothetical protein